MLPVTGPTEDVSATLQASRGVFTAQTASTRFGPDTEEDRWVQNTVRYLERGVPHTLSYQKGNKTKQKGGRSHEQEKRLHKLKGQKAKEDKLIERTRVTNETLGSKAQVVTLVWKPLKQFVCFFQVKIKRKNEKNGKGKTKGKCKKEK